MVKPLSADIQPIVAITATAGAAGQTAINGASLDMDTTGTDSVLILVHFGAIVGGAVTSIKVASDDNTNFTSSQDIAGTSQTVADTNDDKVFMIDVINPPERFIRVVVSRGTQNATVASALYLPYGRRVRPVAAGSDVAGQEIHRNKAVGTA